jgi:hypothetical protein
MTKTEVLNSIYIIPALLGYFRGEEGCLELLKSYDVNPEEYRDLGSLLQYHHEIIRKDFEPNYPLLRKGLTEYFNEFLWDFWSILGITGTNYKMLDYAGGEGIYSDTFDILNPEGDSTLLDRKHGLAVDFQKTPNWWPEYEQSFDIVLLSEILHCKSAFWRDYLVSSSCMLLKSGGRLIINENVDPAMGWRLNRLSEGGLMTESDIIGLMSGNVDFKLVDIKTIEKHKIYIYEKV